QYQLHRARIGVFDLWRDFDNHPGADIMTLFGHGKIATPVQNVEGPRQGFADHEGIVALDNVQVIEVNLTLAQRKLIPDQALRRECWLRVHPQDIRHDASGWSPSRASSKTSSDAGDRRATKGRRRCAAGRSLAKCLPRGYFTAQERFIGPRMIPVAISPTVVDSDVVQKAVHSPQRPCPIEIEDYVGVATDHSILQQDGVLLTNEAAPPQVRD